MLELITGGSGSGKSAYAEERVLSYGEKKRIYIATMYPFDEESKKRVQRHRKMRAGKGFETIERYTDLASLKIPGRPVILLECMSNLVANEMFREDGAGSKTVEAVLRGVAALEEQADAVILVTNEIFSEAACYEGETGTYQEYLGTINQKLGKRAKRVTEVVYGIPLTVKGADKDEEAVE